MRQIPSLPVELLIDIVSYLTPHTPIIGRDAAWTRPHDLLNWWEGPRWKFLYMAASDSESDSSTDSPVGTAVSPYASLLALRQANKQFNAICVPLLYKIFNSLGDRSWNEDVVAEILSLYHCHVRIVRIRVWAQMKLLSEKISEHLLPFFTQGVSSLAVYFDEDHGYMSQEEVWLADEIVRVVDTGHITSFGIYSTSVLYGFDYDRAPSAVKSLLQQITITTPVLSRLTSLDIVVEELDEQFYDAFRTQIGQLDSLTVRAVLQHNLGQVWSARQRDRWFTCDNLTNLQLIECPTTPSSNIPYILQFFPALRTLTFVAWCDEMDQENGWSLIEDSLWRGEAPLESLHIENISWWEIEGLGVIHTRQLTIIMVDEQEPIPFRDEELFPGLQILRTQERYVDSDLEESCARRDIVLESNAQALLPPD